MRSRRRRRWAASAIPSSLPLRGLGALTDNHHGSKPASEASEIETRQVAVNGQLLQVAIKHGSGRAAAAVAVQWNRRQLGIGEADYLEALTCTTAIIFDVPGVGGSPRSLLPYRPSTLARLAAGLVAELGYTEIDVAGVSLGWRDRAAIRASISKTVPAAGARRNRARRHHGAGQSLGAVENGNAAPLHRQGLHEQDRGGYLRRRLSGRPVPDRPACGRDA